MNTATKKKTNKRKTTSNPKVFTTETLRRLCDSAERLKFSNGPNARFWKDVRPDGKHVVAFSMNHSPNLAFWGKAVNDPDFAYNFAHNGGVNVRALVYCAMKDGTRCDLLCDFDKPEFDALFPQK